MRVGRMRRKVEFGNVPTCPVGNGRAFRGSLPSVGGAERRNTVARTVKAGLGQRDIASGESVDFTIGADCIRCNVRDETDPSAAPGPGGGGGLPPGGGPHAPGDDDDLDMDFPHADLPRDVLVRARAARAAQSGNNRQAQATAPRGMAMGSYSYRARFAPLSAWELATHEQTGSLRLQSTPRQLATAVS